jgi:hypothetical protein
LSKIIPIAVVLLALSAIRICAADLNAPVTETHSFESSLIDPFFNIFFIRYQEQVTTHDELVLGFYYLYGTTSLFGPTYPGSYQLYASVLGYKRYLWQGLFAEYLLLPGIASYHDTSDGTNYESFEIWNELHLGYRFPFKMGSLSLYAIPEIIVGIAMYKGNEPQSFRLVEQAKPILGYPDLYILPNICIGIAF